MMYNAGLILEGGGMRGVYTAGVLDCFLDYDIEFSACYGVSAGACHCCSFLSKQRKRAFNINVDYLDNKNYASFYSLLTTGNFFGKEFLYDEIPNKLNPYDYETFDKYKGEFKAVLSNVEIGKAEYISIKDLHKDIIYICASSSLPFLSKIVEIDGKKYLDGGISDSIPLKKSQEDGNSKNVVILTRDKTYRKEKSSVSKLAKVVYRKYPNIETLLKNRYKMYNETVKYIEECEEREEIFVIRPENKVDIGRIEKNKSKLESLYIQGYNDAKKRIDELKDFLSGGGRC